MLLVVPYCKKDFELASRLAGWMAVLGPYPKHQLLLVQQVGAPTVSFVDSGFSSISTIPVTDSGAPWPAGCNASFRAAGKQIEYGQKRPWLWCEPDSVPMRDGWLDEIEAEYLACGKPFLGDFIVPPKNSDPKYIPHISGMSVYPPNLMQLAGEIYHAYDNIPFDIIAGPQILAQAKQSELLFHVWQGPSQPGLAPFTSWSDVEQKILARRPKCALFHSDKTGTLLQLLRERRKEGDEKCAAPVTTCSEEVLPPSPSALSTQAASSAEPTSQPESSAESLRGGEYVYKSAKEIYDTLAYQKFAQTLQTPWAIKEWSVSEIQLIAARLRQFQTNVAYVRFVRSLLAEAGVIVLPKKKKRRKKKK